jgi:LmbE family N-acetylglucosaminyl deacetylase
MLTIRYFNLRYTLDLRNFITLGKCALSPIPFSELIYHKSVSCHMVRIAFFIILFSFNGLVHAQKPVSYDATELLLQLRKLNVLGSVLYVAAHPDDENTRMITYFSKERLYNTAYLSLTRGDGGQNLIGPEIRETLGLIRTHELLGARRIDGGKQFFSRAVDFGFSKTATETFHIWDSVQVLSDVVWVIRQFKPDVIINRFSTEPGETHGHHTASAILAEIGLRLAADPQAFPEQLKYTTVWQPKKLFWNTSRWFYGQEKFDTTQMVMVNLGGYSPLLGKSYTEIAAKARSMHRSQGFGTSTARGDAYEFLKPIHGAKPGTDVFQGIDTSWKRIPGGEKIGRQIEQAIKNFDMENPSRIVPILLNARRDMSRLPDSYWKTVKLEEIDEIIKGCLGLFIEATTNQYSIAHKESLVVTIEAINRSDLPVVLKNVVMKNVNKDTTVNKQMTFNQGFRFATRVTVTDDIPISQPFWLCREGTVGMFSVDDQQMRALPETPPALTAHFEFSISGHNLTFETPIVYKRIDPAIGEVYRPLQVIPAAFATLEKPVYVYSNSRPDTARVTIKAGRGNLSARVSLEVPNGWRVSPNEFSISLKQKGQETIIPFVVTPPDSPSTGALKVHVVSDGHDYSYSLVDINYDHVPVMSWFPEAKSQAVKLDLQKRGNLIGYIAGAGDAVAESLEWIGYDVRYLGDADFNNNQLHRYDAIIVGIRAYNVNNRLRFYQDQLMDYVKNGGVVIVQYNVNRGLVVDNLAPYPLRLSRDRVTDEEAEMKVLAPDHPVMNFPNKIDQKDFDGWVQERGLYFADQWDRNFVPIFSAHDHGEEDSPKKGGLLIAQYGKGYYVYTGYSWFRQLPAGVPGAFRLFANMISLGKEELTIKD